MPIIPSTSASEAAFDQNTILQLNLLSQLKDNLTRFLNEHQQMRRGRVPYSADRDNYLSQNVLNASHTIALSLNSFKNHVNWLSIRKTFGPPEKYRAQALFLALRLSMNVAIHCQHALASANSTDRFIPAGTSKWLEREEIETLRAKGALADQEIKAAYARYASKREIDREMELLQTDPSRQVLHSEGFLKNCARVLSQFELANEGRLLTGAETLQGISEAIEATDHINEDKKALVINGLRLTANRERVFSEGALTTSVANSLATVWTYIAQHPDNTLKENLTTALFERLADIAVERPCDTGCAQRILQTPDGIDQTLILTNVPDDAIADDIAGRVSRLYQWLEQILEDADRQPDFMKAADQNTRSCLTGRSINWMQRTVRDSVIMAYELLGHPQSVYRHHLSRHLDGIESNMLMLNDLALENIGVEYRNYEGKTALMRLVDIGDSVAIEALLQSLTNLPEDVREIFISAKCIVNKTAISHAMQRRHLQAFKTLLESPLINLNRIEPSVVEHPLFYACHHNRVDILEALLSSSAVKSKSPRCNINMRDSFGNTALHVSILRGHNDCVDHLLGLAQCDVNAPNLAGQTPLHSAVSVPNVTAVEYLLNHPEKKNEINVNIIDGRRASALVLLLNHGVMQMSAIELIDPRLSQTREAIKDCILLLLNHPYTDLMASTFYGGNIENLVHSTNDDELITLYETRISNLIHAQPDRHGSSLHTDNSDSDSAIGSETSSAMTDESSQSSGSQPKRQRLE